MVYLNCYISSPRARIIRTNREKVSPFITRSINADGNVQRSMIERALPKINEKMRERKGSRRGCSEKQQDNASRPPFQTAKPWPTLLLAAPLPPEASNNTPCCTRDSPRPTARAISPAYRLHRRHHRPRHRLPSPLVQRHHRAPPAG